MHPQLGFPMAPDWPYIEKMIMTSQFANITSSSNFVDVVLFVLPSLVTDPSFMSMSLLTLEL